MPGTDYVLRSQDYARQLQAPAAKPSEDHSSFSFGDLLDIINPLQHIPVVSTIYRHLTGDTIGTPEKIAGDTLYGGLTGLLCSVGDSLFEAATGKSVGDTVYAAVIGDNSPTTAVAANDTPSAPQSDGNEDYAAAAVTPFQAAAAYRASGRLMAAY